MIQCSEVARNEKRQFKLMDQRVRFCSVTCIKSYVLTGVYSGVNKCEDYTYDSDLESLCRHTEEASGLILSMTPPSGS